VGAEDQLGPLQFRSKGKYIMLTNRVRELAIIIAALFIPSTARPDIIELDIISLSGTVDPISYTDMQGTFTTGIVTLTLDQSSPSFMSLDLTTGELRAHTVMDVVFNNGKPGMDNENLSGTFVVDENGTIGYIDSNGLIQPQPVLLDISNGVLVGAGPFSGTTAHGKNPIYNPDLMQYQWRIRKTGNPPTSEVLLDLPSGFIGGTNTAIDSTINAIAVVVPEPSTLALWSIGALGLLANVWRRRKRDALTAMVILPIVGVNIGLTSAAHAAILSVTNQTNMDQTYDVSGTVDDGSGRRFVFTVTVPMGKSVEFGGDNGPGLTKGKMVKDTKVFRGGVQVASLIPELDFSPIGDVQTASLLAAADGVSNVFSFFDFGTPNYNQLIANADFDFVGFDPGDRIPNLVLHGTNTRITDSNGQLLSQYRFTGSTVQVGTIQSPFIPEPSTLTLLTLGTLGLIGYGWIRRKQAA
jgi:hypothetical protein